MMTYASVICTNEPQQDTDHYFFEFAIEDLKMIIPSGDLPIKKITEFCKKYPIIAKMSLFGSAVSGSLRQDSDVDLLIEFEPGKTPSLFTLINLEDELKTITGRKIDLRTPEELSRY